MKVSILALTSVLAGPCSGTSGDAPVAPASVAPPVAAAASALAAAASAATPDMPVVKAAPHAAPPGAQPATGPCALLAQACKKCPPGVTQLACNGALTAGSLDPSACTNALNDKDIKAECAGGGAAPAAPSGAQPAPAPAPAAGGPCTQLAQKCKKCPAGITQMACNGAVSAGALDPSACTNALSDKDIKAQCN
jgi:pyruvate dehydrogenase E2 component (dihydrolipoamide acetyltransferase)